MPTTTLAHDIFSMTIDAQGRVVVAGAGYVKILHDDDGDGRADRATLFSSVPASGAHGMVFDGPDLICTGDNSVMRLRDADGDGVADGEPEIWTALRHPEHGANGLVRGPDGCYYLICGNDAGISTKQITTAASPVKQPRCGGIVRFSAEGKPLDVFAHGFRNPYDLDFDAAGHLLTVDSDGERDHHLPWYAPTRLFDVAQGMEHGWLLPGWTRGWNRPPSFFDNVERMVEIGRGSPTGVVGVSPSRVSRALSRRRVFGLLDAGPRLLLSADARRGDVPQQARNLHADHRRRRLRAVRPGRGPERRSVRGDRRPADPRQRVSRALSEERRQPAHAAATAGAGARRRSAAGQLVAGPLGADGRTSWARRPSRTRWQRALATAERVRAVEVLVEVFGGLDPAKAEAMVAQSCKPRGSGPRRLGAWARSGFARKPSEVLGAT